MPLVIILVLLIVVYYWLENRKIDQKLKSFEDENFKRKSQNEQDEISKSDCI